MIHLLRPALIAAGGAVGVAVARDNPTDGAAITVIAAVLAVVAAALRERGVAVAALGIGAAASFVTPDGIGPLLVVTGVVLSCDVAGVDRRLVQWRDVIDAAIALPALAGLAGTVAAQPSYRGVALGVAAAGAVTASAWRGARVRTGGPGDLAVLPGVALLAAFLLTLAPQRIDAFGRLPLATEQAANSLAAGFAVFVLIVALGAVRAEQIAPRGRHRRTAR